MKNLHDVKLEHIRGHWEVYIEGKFFCSADTMEEALEEIKRVYG